MLLPSRHWQNVTGPETTIGTVVDWLITLTIPVPSVGALSAYCMPEHNAWLYSVW